MTEFPLSPFPTPAEVDRNTQRRRLRSLLIAAAVVWGLIGLSQSSVSDVAVAGASPSAYVDYCHSTPERKAWCEWQAYMADGRNRAWFAIEQHFPHDLHAARSVADCESHFAPTAYNSSSGASGVFQIVGKYHAAEFERVTGVPFHDGRFDPDLNVKYAADLHRRAGWQPWVCQP